MDAAEGTPQLLGAPGTPPAAPEYTLDGSPGTPQTLDTSDVLDLSLHNGHEGLSESYQQPGFLDGLSGSYQQAGTLDGLPGCYQQSGGVPEILPADIKSKGAFKERSFLGEAFSGPSITTTERGVSVVLNHVVALVKEVLPVSSKDDTIGTSSNNITDLALVTPNVVSDVTTLTPSGNDVKEIRTLTTHKDTDSSLCFDPSSQPEIKDLVERKSAYGLTSLLKTITSLPSVLTSINNTITHTTTVTRKIKKVVKIKTENETITRTTNTTQTTTTRVTSIPEVPDPPKAGTESRARRWLKKATSNCTIL